MRCSRCGCTDTRVLDSRDWHDGVATRRRRECRNCGQRWSTLERRWIAKYDAQEISNAILYVVEKKPGVTLTSVIKSLDHPYLNDEIAHQTILEQIDTGLIPVSRTTDTPARLFLKENT